MHCLKVLAGAVLFSLTAVFAYGQTQSVNSGCGANIGSVANSTLSVQVDCTKSNGEPLSLQYVRLFGAVEVPLVLGLFGRPELKAESGWGKKFRDFLAPDGEEAAVHIRTIKAFQSYSFKDARPILTKLWIDLAANADNAGRLAWLATAGSRRERVCFFTTQEADGSGYSADVLVEKKIIASEKSCDKTVRKFDYRVGFTF